MVLHTQPGKYTSLSLTGTRASRDGEALGCHVQPPHARVARLGLPASPIPGPLPGVRPPFLPATLLRTGTTRHLELRAEL